ncbi:MAG: DUF433 domain-containing protein [Terriglobales bacterium]|jgi:uncharacterized protein (DUF433 family)
MSAPGWGAGSGRTERIVWPYYIEKREGGCYVAGSRVSLESVIHQFRDGASPETIGEEFPTLSLEQVYGAITFYLGNRDAIDAYLAESEKLWDEARKQQPLPAALRERLERARREPAAKHS